MWVRVYIVNKKRIRGMCPKLCYYYTRGYMGYLFNFELNFNVVDPELALCECYFFLKLFPVIFFRTIARL